MTAQTEVKTRKPRKDIMQQIADSKGHYWYGQNLHYLLAAHHMNYWKFLCIQWMSTTGKPCTKRDHIGQEGMYKFTLECEAQLVESLVIAKTGAGNTFKKIKENLLSVHADMGCECDWTPKLNPLEEIKKLELQHD